MRPTQTPQPKSPTSEPDIVFFVDRMSGDEFSLLDGRLGFVLDAELGKGGQAQVLSVSLDGRRYALKMYANKDDAETEWQALRLHENDLTVPRPYAYGLALHKAVDLDLHSAVVMELIEGTNLGALLSDPDACSALTCEQALAYIKPIVRFGSNACNSRTQIPHRDIKPDNIVINADGQARLLDFGLCKDERVNSESVGTFGFAAPEQMFADVDTQMPSSGLKADTYSMCATLYAMLANGICPGYADDYSPLGSLYHDEDFVSRLYGKVRQELLESFGEVASDSDLQAAVSDSLVSMDARISRAVDAGLAVDPKVRVLPDALESMLPLNKDDYEYRLFTDALLSYVRSDTDAETVAYPQFDTEEDHEFIDALDYFNCGMYDKAVPIFMQQEAKRNTSAMYYLGLCIRDGLGGLPRDPQRVAVLFSQAAKQGNILAQNAFGVMLYEGDGVDRNQAKGIEWIRESARDDEASGRIGFGIAKAWLRDHGLD
ncbi:Serine/threonine-protein kinase pknD [Slackia heliotrinireducens]|uniref:Serine/threonine protein kinase n=1 Tax=Slackia heliotrinireducens (strain ATCC 29202 / DSM 20476 / NCTC 11029 / RHS 1) TaxID=471855 RepID=C7N645_SLAHD|nr:protein kinase [Slackia heliotrinireducens]ACV22380.1 serine/threonine protein kinase [Slackia heliotrinireducens DSM 20476]VEH00673.1 Serine/threonine-protein kinase pknD [Slackia heliotrinireducens]